MVRTGARAKVLSDLLAAASFRLIAPPPAPGLDSIQPREATLVRDLYMTLGGVQNDPRLRTGGWDLAVEAPDGEVTVIELDEELHFNRYRRATLDAPWYRHVPWATEYATLCAAHAERCRAAGSWGKRWSNPSCERLFGPAGDPSDLTGPGAPRWKQRALYDAIKDLAALSGTAPTLARLSIYDTVDGVQLKTALNYKAVLNPAALTELVAQRRLDPSRRSE